MNCGLCQQPFKESEAHFCAAQTLPGLSALPALSFSASVEFSSFQRALLANLERIAVALEKGNEIERAGRTAQREYNDKLFAFHEKATKDTLTAMAPACPDCGKRGGHETDCFRA